jgi:hypothetical protein
MLAFPIGDLDAAANPQNLRDLALWYREFAERTQNPTIWEARIRTAEQLEMNALALETRRPQNVETAIA